MSKNKKNIDPRKAARKDKALQQALASASFDALYAEFNPTEELEEV